VATVQKHQRDFHLALQHYQAGRLREAEDICRRILLLDPREADALHLLGVIAWQSGRHDEAVELIRRSLALRPENAEAHYHLGNALRDRGEMDEAISAFCRAISIKPAFAAAHCNLGTALAAKGELDEAIAAQRKAISLRPALADGHYNLANALRDKGAFAEAIGAYRHAIVLRANFPDAFYNLGNALREMGKLDEAIEAFGSAIVLNPKFRQAHSNLGIVLRQRGRLAEALAASRQAVAVESNHPNAHYNLGETLKDLKKLDEAALSYRRAIALDGQNADYYRGLGQALELGGNITEAIEAFREAQRRAPGVSASGFDLAALGAGEVPPASPRDLVVGLFDEYAQKFDEHLAELKYNGPQLLFDAVCAARPKTPLDIIDLGCGTGLCGVLFRPMARRIVGVDLSPRMIQMAKERGVYDELCEEDLVAALRQRRESADLILAADVFIYLGRLDETFGEVYSGLRAGGLFAFTIEHDDSADYVLRRSRRYAQSVEYLRRLARELNFAEISVETVVLRMEKDQPVDARVVVLRK
jgi:predicted TPR repeat methyltransferase